MTKALSIAELAEMAEQTEDQSEVQVLEFNNDPPPAGKTVGRFIEYLELGTHAQKDYKGKPKPPASMVRLTFELLHPTKNIKEYEDAGEKKITGQYVSLVMAKKLNDKAKFYKLFLKMTYGRPIKHFARMLGEAFIIDIYHNIVEKDGKKQTYVNIDNNGEYGVAAPYVVDPISEERKDVPVRDNIRPLRLFLWDNPTKECWDSLFIDGTREQKNASGETEQVSKNWLQEKILSAVNYTGSALNALLGGVDDLPTDEDKPEPKKEEKPAVKPAAKPATKPVAQPAEKATVKPKVKAPEKKKPAAGGAEDALAALGLG